MRSRPRRLRKQHEHGELRAVVDETVALFHRLRWVAEEAYGPDGRSIAQRGVLRGLVRHGPQTPAHLARVRSVTRQHIQEVLQGLLAAGLVRIERNPERARSKLVHPTSKGIDRVEHWDRIDLAVLGAVSRSLDVDALGVTARMLRRIRERLENGAVWRPSLQKCQVA